MVHVRARFPCVLALLLAGCHGPARPPVTNVSLELQLSAASALPGDVVTISATVSNLGETTVLHGACCYSNGIGLWVLDPDGKPVRLYTGELPACPCWFNEPLRPGMHLQDAYWPFNGKLYDERGEPYEAPRGRTPTATADSHQR